MWPLYEGFRCDSGQAGLHPPRHGAVVAATTVRHHSRRHSPAVSVAVSLSADGTVDLLEARLEVESVVADSPHLSWVAYAWFEPRELTRTLSEFVGPFSEPGRAVPTAEEDR